MKKAKITTIDNCTNAIREMSFEERCLCRLDHATTLFLQKQGYKLNGQKKLYGGKKRIPGIPEIIKRSLTWTKFFLETPLSFWDVFPDIQGRSALSENYDIWFRNRYVTGRVTDVEK